MIFFSYLVVSSQLLWHSRTSFEKWHEAIRQTLYQMQKFYMGLIMKH